MTSQPEEGCDASPSSAGCMLQWTIESLGQFATKTGSPPAPDSLLWGVQAFACLIGTTADFDASYLNVFHTLRNCYRKMTGYVKDDEEGEGRIIT